MTTLPKNVITKLLNDSTTLVKDDQQRAFKAFGYIVKVYFGINAETVDMDVYATVFKDVCEKYPNLTFEQLNLSYSESVIDKRQGVGITRDELLRPVASFWCKTQLIIHEAYKLSRKSNEELTKQQEIIRFKNESMELYIECLNNGTEWTGTPFQASSFAQNFAHKFDQEEKDAVWIWAKKESNRMKIESANKFTTELAELAELLISDKHLFCNEIVNRALLRKLQLIVD